MTNIYEGKILPPLRKGMVYAALIQPGGRYSVCQRDPLRLLMSSELAVTWLRQGNPAYVRLEDAEDVLRRYHYRAGTGVG